MAQFQRLASIDAIIKIFHLQVIPSSPSVLNPQLYQKLLASLIDEFAHMFEKPNGLPPPCRTNHKILILQGSNPVNVRPYRYSHFQKQEIKRLIGYMMETRLIQISCNPHSSLVLLVRKKDRSWQFCVDY